MNIETINEFVEQKLNGRKSALASEIELANMDEMAWLFCVSLYSSNEAAGYKVEFNGGKFTKFNRTMTDFEIIVK